MAMTTAYDRRLLTTTSETTVFTAGSSGAVITQIAVANNTASAATILVTLNDSSTGKIALIPTMTVAAYTVTTVDLKQPLGASKSVFATAGTSNAISIHTAGVNL